MSLGIGFFAGGLGLMVCPFSLAGKPRIWQWQAAVKYYTDTVQGSCFTRNYKSCLSEMWSTGCQTGRQTDDWIPPNRIHGWIAYYCFERTDEDCSRKLSLGDWSLRLNCCTIFSYSSSLIAGIWVGKVAVRHADDDRHLQYKLDLCFRFVPSYFNSLIVTYIFTQMELPVTSREV